MTGGTWIERLLGKLFFHRPPAALIIFGNMAAFFFGLGFLIVNVLQVLPPGDGAAALMVAFWAIGTILSDVAYRRSVSRSLLDLESSTIYGFIPGWSVGVGLLFFAACLYQRS